ncbi:unnamed protein product [Effrenium voratum]|uniref:SET domain-containing protein n=1 Tax=Effrenium voratum TaxID=2562239 RepID=A0AA36JHW0_9DINO|nr:unnamed protein product [Effrenium voratum]CAJ1420358.1 unnamed protein product [Effrenium voratum]
MEGLEAWIRRHGRCEAVAFQVGSRGRGAFAAESLQGVEELCRLPAKLLITEARAAAGLPWGAQLREAAEEFTGAPGLLVLTSFLLHEDAKKHAASESACDSFYAPYYRALPKDLNTPMLWPEAWHPNCIRGSHLERLIKAKRHSLALEFTLLQSHHEKPISWEDFLWARSIVASRAYALPELHRCLVPWADLLNHGTAEEVAVRYTFEGNADDGEFVMTLCRPLVANEELLQSYGRKPNALLLLDYGFVLPYAHAVVSLPLRPPAKEAQLAQHIWRRLGGRDRETSLEVDSASWTKLLPLWRAASLEGRETIPEEAEVLTQRVKDVWEISLEIRALRRFQEACDAALQKLQPAEAGAPAKAEWEIFAERCCTQVVQEERSLLNWFSWLIEAALSCLEGPRRDWPGLDGPSEVTAYLGQLQAMSAPHS